MARIEARPIIEDPKFLKLEVESVVLGFRILGERPNLLLKADTPEAKRVCALLQTKKNRGERWTGEDFKNICGVVFAEVDTLSLHEFEEKMRGYVGDKGVDDVIGFLIPLKTGIVAYVSERKREAETKAE